MENNRKPINIQKRKAIENLALEMQSAPSRTDPDGSYTGIPEDPWEIPVQDADDL